jgi:hypothetical protein
MDCTKDIVLIIGQNAVGKTTAFRYLTWIAEQRGIVYEPEPISDFLFILKQALMDDERGGFHHYHNWSEAKIGGHSHKNGEATIPFAITHNDLVDGMQEEFLQTITLLPRFGKLRFVEWTGGINTNPPEEPASRVDFSFNRVAKKIQEDLLPIEWVERVHAVVHISAKAATRIFFNTKDSEDQSSQILSGHASARRMPTVLNLFGHGDFYKIEPLFKKAGVRLVFDVCNKGDGDFYKDLRQISDVIF